MKHEKWLLCPICEKSKSQTHRRRANKLKK